ncbi:MAG: hypothetical protein ACI94Y_004432 [Maribacter sp.]|jgi:hypothetical protein
MTNQIVYLFLFLLPLSIQYAPISFTNVEKVSDTTAKNELFKKAENWFERKALTGEMDLILNSKGQGQLIGELYFDYDAKNISGGKVAKGKIKCTMVVSVKDGRYKYLLKNFEHIPNGALRKKYSFGILTNQVSCPDEVNIPLTKEDWRDKVWRDMKLRSKKKAQSIVKDLRVSMNENEDDSVDVEDNW